MAIQVAVRQRAIPLQLAERQTLGVSDERGEHAEAGALVNHAIKAVISKARSGRRSGLTLAHRISHSRIERRRRPVIVQLRKEYPWSTATASEIPLAGSGSSIPRSGTRPRPQT